MPKNEGKKKSVDKYGEMGIEERIDLNLRNLYAREGYKRFKMGKFEDYELYTVNKDFIPTESIITVTGSKGKLLAMRPDITLSIVKYFRPEEKSKEKLYYSENIYRSDKEGSYQELKQVGLECVGKIGPSDVKEVTLLAAKSLRSISKEYIMELSHMGFIQEMLIRVPDICKPLILDAISRKNPDEICLIGKEYGLPESEVKNLKALTTIYGDYKSVIPKLKDLQLTRKCQGYIKEISDIADALSSARLGGKINIDFSIVNNMTYYSGILFRGYVPGISEGILSGGRYDGLMDRMKKDGGAVGFAIYLDQLTEPADEEKSKKTQDEYINIALPKGRLGENVYEMFALAGYECPDILEPGRKLIFENADRKVRYFWVKPSDVAVYVERGAADIGVVGKDILLESEPDVYELLDMNTGKCRMCVAAPKGFKDDPERTLKVATKFSNIAKKYYQSVGRDIDIVHLNGSIEIAPILKLTDVIVDIVETGNTLKENDLEVIETIVPDISARFIANKTAFKFKSESIEGLTRSLSDMMENA